MKRLPRRSFELSPKKRALLDALLQEEGVESAASAEFARRTGSTPPILSFAQQRLWFLDQWEPGNPFYIITRELLISGPLQRTALEKSLNEIVKRHEALRTTFAVSAGEPVQVIAPLLVLPLRVIDLRGL